MNGAERQPDFKWAGKPVYRCRACPYERVENLAAVLEHEAETHGMQVRESPILGPDSKPVLVTEGGMADFGESGAPVVLHGAEAIAAAPAGSKKTANRRRRT